MISRWAGESLPVQSSNCWMYFFTRFGAALVRRSLHRLLHELLVVVRELALDLRELLVVEGEHDVGKLGEQVVHRAVVVVARQGIGGTHVRDRDPGAGFRDERLDRMLVFGQLVRAVPRDRRVSLSRRASFCASVMST
jgi:hypothetical protein